MSCGCNSMRGGRRRRHGRSRRGAQRPTLIPGQGGSRRHRRSRRGGMGSTVNYGSAGNYALATVGTGDVQYKNVFGPGPKYPEGNEIVSLTGQKAGTRRHRRSRKGGFWGEVVKQAIVPFALLGMQQKYGKKTRKHRKH